MDEIKLENDLNRPDIRRNIENHKDLWEGLAWQGKYARFPRLIGGHFVWRRYYWRRQTTLHDYDYVYALKEPKLEGRYYNLWDMLHQDHIHERHLRKKLLRVK